MAYKRKTHDEWQLLANYGYGQGFELETVELTYVAIKQRLKEYRENAPRYCYKIQRKRVKL